MGKGEGARSPLLHIAELFGPTSPKSHWKTKDGIKLSLRQGLSLIPLCLLCPVAAPSDSVDPILVSMLVILKHGLSEQQLDLLGPSHEVLSFLPHTEDGHPLFTQVPFCVGGLGGEGCS